MINAKSDIEASAYIFAEEQLLLSPLPLRDPCTSTEDSSSAPLTRPNIADSKVSELTIHKNRD